MFSTLILLLLSIKTIESDILISEKEGERTPAPIDEGQGIRFTVVPNKDYFGRAVIVTAEPPYNYSAWLYGPYSSVEPRLVPIWFNESGVWDRPGYRGSLTPYTWYNLTIIWGTKNFSTSFITDMGVPIGGVYVNFIKNGFDFVEINLQPEDLKLLNGPPTGFHVDACLAPHRESCSSYVCSGSPCRLDKLRPATNYIVNASVFNVDSFNRTLERRDYIKLYNVTTLGPQDIEITVVPNKDYFGRAVIVTAEPPHNYTAWLYGPFSSIEPRLVPIWFNESGVWDRPGFEGDLEPYTWYNLTIIGETKNSSTTFITDVGEPIGGVDMNFTKNGADFVEVNLQPEFTKLVNGPPTGYHVDACLAAHRESCSSYVCSESPCRLDKLRPATSYIVNASVFNVDSFNRTLERRDYIKLYNVTTQKSQDIKITVTPNKDCFGKAVIVTAEPPYNYTAWLEGPFYSIQRRLVQIWFNESGVWDDHGNGGGLDPYTWYNLTIIGEAMIGETKNFSTSFITDMGVPIGGVDMNFTKKGSDFVEISLQPEDMELLNGPPTGFHVDACLAPHRESCLSYVCSGSPCRLDKLRPATNYIVNASVFNVDSFNRTLERRDYIKLYNVTTLGGSQDIKFTVTPSKDCFGKAVIVTAEPPYNYKAWLEGPFYSVRRRLVPIDFNESGVWDDHGNGGGLTPYTLYNLTIIGETKNSSTSFITDVGVPIGGVHVEFTKKDSNFVEISLQPQNMKSVYGPPTGYHVDACLAPQRESCYSYVCSETPCRLDNLRPATNYTVNASIFNVDSFNRTLERRDFIMLYDVTTMEGSSGSSSIPWILTGGAIAGVCGFGGIYFARRKLSQRASRRRLRPSDTPAAQECEL